MHCFLFASAFLGTSFGGPLRQTAVSDIISNKPQSVGRLLLLHIVFKREILRSLNRGKISTQEIPSELCSRFAHVTFTFSPSKSFRAEVWDHSGTVSLNRVSNGNELISLTDRHILVH